MCIEYYITIQWVILPCFYLSSIHIIHMLSHIMDYRFLKLIFFIIIICHYHVSDVTYVKKMIGNKLSKLEKSSL